ncbi:MAG: hypothetical protein AUG49_13905 [Catenulispora sp. 13_1_20CM_3_70_7]|nr:MAG: hypothetical protein AUG49_13905 [Catenulispora sp. 13_1_20CM_3_70_7]
MNEPSDHDSFTRDERFTANEADLAWRTRYQQRVRNHDVHTPHQILQELTAFEMPVPGFDGGQYTTYIHDHPFDDPRTPTASARTSGTAQ